MYITPTQVQVYFIHFVLFYSIVGNGMYDVILLWRRGYVMSFSCGEGDMWHHSIVEKGICDVIFVEKGICDVILSWRRGYVTIYCGEGDMWHHFIVKAGICDVIYCGGDMWRLLMWIWGYITWANMINFVVNHAPGAGSIVPHVDL